MSINVPKNIENGICIIAGEASGDAQAALLIHELSSLLSLNYTASKSLFWGIGGPHLRKAGMEIIVPSEDLAVMGIFEIAKQYLFISKTYKKLLFEVISRKPGLIIVVDYPGFNVRFAEEVTRLGFQVVYYIPPKVWSHGLSRIEKLKKYTKLLVSILPFETEFFKRHGLNAIFIGNPLFDEVNRYLNASKDIREIDIVYDKTYPYQIGMLPGSRKAEVERMLPLMIESFIELQKTFPNIKAKVPVAQILSLSFVENIFLRTCKKLNIDAEKLREKILFLEGQTYKVMHTSNYAWVCSGTATLETAFFKTPLSAIYKLSPPTAILAKVLLKIKYVSLVNLCMNQEIIPEFLQYSASVKNLVNHAIEMLSNREQREKMISNFETLRNLFPENAARHAAYAVLSVI